MSRCDRPGQAACRRLVFQPGRLEELDQAVQALLAVVHAEASMDTSGMSPQGRGRWDKAE